MDEKNIVVWIWDNYKGDDYIRNSLLEVSEAIKQLGKRGLELTINPKEAKWKIIPCNEIQRFSGSSYFYSHQEYEIGTGIDFEYRGDARNIHYHVGVYDRTNIEHLQSMIESVKYEGERLSEGYDTDSL